MTVEDGIVVVGASLAGLRAIEAMRREGYAGPITALSAEPHFPYDRPPLSKQFLKGDWDEDKLSLRREGFDDLDVDWRLGAKARSLDAEKRRLAIATDSGSDELEYGSVLITTGAAPRTLPGVEGLEGIHLLRSLDDARRLADECTPGTRVVVVGAGFIGMETAASLREVECEVTVVEALEAPLLRGLGVELGSWVGERHREKGVKLRCGVGVKRFIGEERIEVVELGDGSRLPADVVVIGIGVVPCCAWLKGTGLDVSNGILCDAKGATALPGVYAAGDVARWYNPRFDEAIRYEHWTSAVEQSSVVARRMVLGDEATEPLSQVPYVWSDQFELRIAITGEVVAGDRMAIRHGSLEEDRFLALFGGDGKLTGAVGMRRPRQLNACRDLIEEGVGFEEALESIGG